MTYNEIAWHDSEPTQIGIIRLPIDPTHVEMLETKADQYNEWLINYRKKFQSASGTIKIKYIAASQTRYQKCILATLLINQRVDFSSASFDLRFIQKDYFNPINFRGAFDRIYEFTIDIIALDLSIKQFDNRNK